MLFLETNSECNKITQFLHTFILAYIYTEENYANQFDDLTVVHQPE